MSRLLALAMTLLLARAAHAAAPPDWSGWWTTAPPLSEEWLRQLPPLKPAALAQWNRQARPNDDADPLRFCRPLQFTGYSGGFEGALEFLFTPGRVTITAEDGRIRRIYTDGRPIPPQMDASASGISVGRWEGSTLVVTTTHLDPRSRYPSNVFGSMAIGNDARIEERITLQDPDTLVFDITTHAPDVLTAPDRRKRVYRRVQKSMAQEISFCADGDRSVDPAGRVQFDMTPPKDLSPPPPPPPAR